MKNPITTLLLAAMLVAAFGCQHQAGKGKPADVDYYTCTMHPSVHESAPGNCPICGMELVPVKKKDDAARKGAEILAKVLLAPPSSLRRVDLIEAVMQKTSQSEPTAARKIKDWIGWGIIKKHADGYYRFNME